MAHVITSPRNAVRRPLQNFMYKHSSSSLWYHILYLYHFSPGAAALAAHCSGCVFTVCVCVHYCVCALGWVKCRAQIPSMGHHTWPQVTSNKKSNLYTVLGASFLILRKLQVQLIIFHAIHANRWQRCWSHALLFAVKRLTTAMCIPFAKCGEKSYTTVIVWLHVFTALQ